MLFAKKELQEIFETLNYIFFADSNFNILKLKLFNI